MLCFHFSGFQSPTLIDDVLLHVKFTLGRAGFWTGFFQNVFSFLFWFLFWWETKCADGIGRNYRAVDCVKMGQRDRYLTDMMDDFNPSD